MANLNKVLLIGNLTRDPEMSYTPKGTAVCKAGLAVNRTWRGPDGSKQEEVCFVDVNLFGKQAETFNQYMKKGRPVFIEGRLKFETWDGQDGQKKSKLRVVAEGFQFLGGRGEGGDEGGGGYRGGDEAMGEGAPAPRSGGGAKNWNQAKTRGAAPAPRAQGGGQPAQPSGGYEEDYDNLADEEIPF